MDYSMIISGSLLFAAGFVLFIIPYKIVPGGVVGLAIITNLLSSQYQLLTNGFPVGLAALCFNIPLFIIANRVLGPRFGIKSLLSIIFTSFFIDLLSYLIPTPDFLNLSDERLLAGLFGGVLIGVGSGLILKARAFGLGSDMVAMIIAKFTRKPLGILLIYFDSAVIITAFLFTLDWQLPLYSWAVMFIFGKVTDSILQGANYEKSIMIVTENAFEAIRDKIIVDLQRGGTIIHGSTFENGKNLKIIYTVATQSELSVLTEFISQVDPSALVTVTDSSEILGKGFKSLLTKIRE